MDAASFHLRRQPIPLHTKEPSTGAFVNRRPFVEALENRAYLAGVAFFPFTQVPTGQFPNSVAAADLSGNGKQDVVTSNYGDGTVSVLMGNGDGTFQPAVNYPVGNGPRSVVLADVNGDGKPDIIVANSGTNPADTSNTDINTVSVLLNNGNGTFAPKVDYPTGLNPSAVAVGDMNNDGRPDLIVTSATGNNVEILLNEGNGTFGPRANFPTAVRPLAVAVADLSGNGDLDVVTANVGNNSVSVLLGRGDGTLKARVNYATGSFPQNLVLQDINQDKKIDIVVACRGSSTVNILLGHGNGAFASNTVYPSGGGAYGLAVHDLNGDNLPEIITSDQAARFVNVMLRSKMHSFFPQVSYKVGFGNEGVAVADFNGDGQPDLAIASFNDSSISVLINNSKSLTLQKTAVKLTASSMQVTEGATVNFTATVTSGNAVPTGNVVLYDGDSGIATAALVNKVATFSIANLAVGEHSLNAYFPGDSTFAANSSANISVLVTAAAPGPDLVATFVNTPAALVAGQPVAVSISVTNQGNQVARGSITNELFASPDDVLDNSAIPLTISGAIKKARLRLLPGRSVILTGRIMAPANATAGDVFLLAEIDVSNSVNESDTTNNGTVTSI
jgi:Bacterial Ig-like domain (group 3)/FG-GAP-like repeat/CARDB/FG-GAP repeat